LKATVASLRKGQKGIIQEFPDDFLPTKLFELGCLPGNLVELVQVAPLGDPLYIDVNGTHLAIRKSLAENIVVTLVQHHE